jgi:hypothetical protein
MSMLRAARVRAEKNARGPRRIATVSIAGPAARGASGCAPARPPLSSFVARCVRSWIAARESAQVFLATWTPVQLPEPSVGGSAQPDRARRKPSSARRGARRAAQYPAQPSAKGAALGPAAAAGGAEALRARYPLVSALLVELAAPRRRVATGRSQQRW